MRVGSWRPRALHGRNGVLAIAIVAILLRFAAQAAVGFFEHPETWEEGTIAADLAAGRGYGYEQFGSWVQAFRGPAYPILLGSAYALFGTSAVVAGSLNALLGGMTAAAAVLLGHRIGPWPAAAFAGLGVATHPGLLVYSAKVHQLNLDALLIALAALFVVIAIRAPAVWTALGSGIVGGALALSRPTALPFIGLAALLVPLATRTRRSVRWSALMLAITLTVAGVWVGRNWAVTGEVTLTTSTGLAMWTGHNPAATGGAATSDGRPMWEADPEILDRVYGRGEVEQDRVFREAAVAYILEDPGRAARRVLGHFEAFWWFGPTAGFSYPAVWLTAYAAYYVVLVAFAATGAVWMSRHGHATELLIIGALALVVAALQALFYVEGRHRWAIEALIVAVAASGLARAAGAIPRRASRP